MTPYYAVIFTSKRNPGSEVEYEQAGARMAELASQQPGFLGMDSVRAADGTGITTSYWASQEAIMSWKRHFEHALAQKEGRQSFYASYSVRVCRVEREYSF